MIKKNISALLLVVLFVSFLGDAPALFAEGGDEVKECSVAEFSDSEIEQMLQEAENEEVADKNKYCQACMFSYQKVSERKPDDDLYERMFKQCSFECGLDQCDEVDPVFKWKILKEAKKVDLSDPKKKMEHCKKCEAFCDGINDKKQQDPLNKWRCFACERDCAETNINKEKKNESDANKH